ncbi:hypothetical protein [Pseudomonas asiatica]|uniref:hypothetical protein n=1 Tax=Pseudomonas asiatica TaxID=2219225 RepID=UPI0018AAF475|nr:hypothetical protein [Pseudomonas asiatica]MBF8806954.1 hypothetical protein [Pseudomonas asiatica]
MIINDDKSVEFEVGDCVCDITTGEERCGVIEEIDDTMVRVSCNEHHGKEWWVDESRCYPG